LAATLVAGSVTTDAQSGSCTDGSYRCAVLTDVPTYYSRLTDLSGFQVVSGTAGESVAGALVGDSDPGIELSGAGVVRSQSTVNLLGTNAYTMEAWVKFDGNWTAPFGGDYNVWADVPAQVRIESMNSSLGAASLPRESMRFARGRFNVVALGEFNEGPSESAVEARDLNPMTPGEWHHLVLTVNLDYAAFYVNGNLAVEGVLRSEHQSSFFPPVFRSGRLVIENTLGSAARTSFDEIAIYRRALTRERVVAHYNAGRPELTGGNTAALETQVVTLQASLAACQATTLERSAQIAGLTQQITDLTAGATIRGAQFTDLQAQLATANAGMAACTATADAQLSTINQLNAQIAAARASLVTAQADVSTLTLSVNDAQGQVANLTTQVAQVNARVTDLTAQLAASQSAASSLRDQLATATAEVSQLEGQLAAAATENAALREQHTTAQARVTAVEAELAASRAEETSLQQALATAQSQAASLNVQLSNALAQVTTATTQLAAANGEVVGLTTQLATLSAEANALQSQVQALNTANATLTVQVAALNAQLAALSNDYQTVVRASVDFAKWEYGAWSACQGASRGNPGTATRNASCVSRQGLPLPDASCTDLRPPRLTRSCAR